MNMEEINKISGIILNSAIEVHKELGPGLLESVYEVCLMKELTENGLEVKRQVELPVFYKGEKLNSNFRLDLLVQDAIIVELKTVDKLLPVHIAQVLTYLKLSDKKLGLLINFNEAFLKHGFKRIIL